MSNDNAVLVALPGDAVGGDIGMGRGMFMQRNHIWVGVVVVVMLALSGRVYGRAVSADEIATLRANAVAWHTRRAPSARTVRDSMHKLRPDGSWPNVDYTNTDRGGWKTYMHLVHTLALVQAYKQPGHELAGDAELHAAIVRAFGHWVRADYVNPNWWYPQIGVPRAVSQILVLMGDEMPAELVDKATNVILARSRMGMTGQNKVWLAGIAFFKGMLAEDGDLMAQARAQIVEELHITTTEGVQPDYSFHQHGPQLQWGNYGAGFSGDMIQWASIFKGTTYAIDSDVRNIIGNYLADGTGWILWRGRMDISGCGRQIFRECQRGKGATVLGQLRMMAKLDPENAPKYDHVIAANRLDADNAFVGHKHFWRSDISVHRRPTWYASVKMSSVRVIGAETCNSENMLGLHLGDGVTYFHRSGGEYEDLFPVWDWQRLPGTTCAQSQRSLVPGSRRCRGRSDLVGGVCDGKRGVAAMEYIREGLRARKAWFFLDDAVVCLGAGITSEGSDPVRTSINQCLLGGPITVSTGQQEQRLSTSEPLRDRLAWVHHDGMLYAFPQPQTVTVQGTTQSGDWHRVHHRETTKPVKRKVFSLWIDHGTKPTDAQYAYAVSPDATADKPEVSESRWPVTILEQTASLLAIASDDGRRIQAVFFEPGRLEWDQDSVLEVDAPSLIMLDRSVTPARLYVADPTHHRKVLNVALSGWYDAERTIDLPVEGQAGRTVSVDLRR